MRKLQYLRYIAAGFKHDADKLLNEFVGLKTFEFCEFSKLWKKHNFSFIFMGRENNNELKEFTEECFRNTVEYLSPTNSYLLKAGAIYLLYGLYLKQPVSPKMMIRIQRSEFLELQKMLDKASKNNHKSLCFVIHTLHAKSAFCYVALPKLMGPLVITSKEVEKDSLNELYELKETCEEFLQSDSLNALSQIHNSYVQAKQCLVPSEESSIDVLLENRYDEAFQHLTALMKNDKYLGKATSQSSNLTSKGEDIGARRAKLKAAQFLKKTEYYLRRSQSDSQSEDSNGMSAMSLEIPQPKPKKGKVKSKKTKNKRGRPKKVLPVEESESSEEDIFSNNFLSYAVVKVEDEEPKGRVWNRSVRRKHHYAEDKKNRQN